MISHVHRDGEYHGGRSDRPPKLNQSAMHQLAKELEDPKNSLQGYLVSVMDSLVQGFTQPAVALLLSREKPLDILVGVKS